MRLPKRRPRTWDWRNVFRLVVGHNVLTKEAEKVPPGSGKHTKRM